MWPGLNLHLRHDRVPHDARDQPGESVAHGLRNDNLAGKPSARFSDFLSKSSELGPVDHLPTRDVGARRDPPTLGPAADGVVAHPEELGGLLDPEHWHKVDCSRMIGISIEYVAHLPHFQIETGADAWMINWPSPTRLR